MFRRGALEPRFLFSGFNIGASVYHIIRMVFEERKLLRQLGVEYKRCQKRVPILFPCIKPKQEN